MTFKAKVCERVAIEQLVPGRDLIMQKQNEYKYILKPGWPGDSVMYAAPQKNEILRVFFDPQRTGTKQMSVWLTTFHPGQGPGLHTHPAPHEELLYIVSGRGWEKVGDEERAVETGDIIFVPPDTEHQLINTGEDLLTLLVVASPPGNIENELYVKPLNKVVPNLRIEY